MKLAAAAWVEISTSTERVVSIFMVMIWGEVSSEAERGRAPVGVQVASLTELVDLLNEDAFG